jgi:dihydroorotate dehydrogenase
MPDWSYRTVFRPVLFRLPAATARGLCLGAMGRLARLPLGPRVIDFLGHMRPDARLRRTVLGVTFPSPIGLGPYLDVHAVALPALARFGVGFLDIGPVSVAPVRAATEVERLTDRQAVGFPEPFPNCGADELAKRLERTGPLGVPVILRLGADSSAVAGRLACFADVLAIDAADDRSWSALAAAVAPKPLLSSVPADMDPGQAESLVKQARNAGAAGVLVDGRMRSAAGSIVGAPTREPAVRLVRHLRAAVGPDFPVIAAGGVHEPADALALVDAGADLVEVDTGLVFGGPGLPKRVNEAVLAAAPPALAGPLERAVEMSWFWATLLGAAMLIGGALALAIAATRIVLPYDEAFVGLTRDQFATINPRLLAFMAHDRVSLAGTMLAIGVFYLGLSLYGIRRGLHWARVTVLSSAFAGFGSFFLFLGFGYFDPFHAFVTAVLFQFLLLALHGRLGTPVPPRPDLREDRAWRLSQ